MRQLCEHLDQLDISSRQMRIAVELLIDTGRRPEEICTLGFDCLDRDSDGAPVLVYDNHKAARRRRLPVSEATAQLIIAQQSGSGPGSPARPVGELKLLPTDRQPRRPQGHHGDSFASGTGPGSPGCRRCCASDGTEYDKAKISRMPTGTPTPSGTPTPASRSTCCAS